MDNLNRRGFFSAMAGLMGSSIFTLAAHEEPKKQVQKQAPQRIIHFEEGFRIHTITLTSNVPPIFNRKNKDGFFIIKNDYGFVTNLGCPFYPSVLYQNSSGIIRDYNYDKYILIKEMFGNSISIAEIREVIEKHKKYDTWKNWENITINIIQLLHDNKKAYYLSEDLLELSTDFSN